MESKTLLHDVSFCLFMARFLSLIPDWVVVYRPFVDERQEGSEDGVLRHGLEHATRPDHVREAGGPGGEHHAHQHEDSNEPSHIIQWSRWQTRHRLINDSHRASTALNRLHDQIA